MRRRVLERLIKRLRELQEQELTRDQALMKLGAAKKEAGNVWRLLDIVPPPSNQPRMTNSFQFSINRAKLRQARQREGRYLLRSNLTETAPATLWAFYIQLTEVEQAFKELKNDLSVRPIHHQLDRRIEAHNLRCLPRLLPASHTQGPPQATGRRPDPAIGHREVRQHPDARCAPATHRRTRTHPDPIHRTRKGSPPAAAANESRAALPTAPEDLPAVLTADLRFPM